MASWAEIAAALPYGFSVCWAVKIEGIPLLLTEYDLSGTDPTGYTSDACLVIDGSDKIGSQVDTRSGIGKAYDLSVRILSTAATREIFLPPSAATRLVGDLAWDETTEIQVDDASDFTAGGGTAYLGREAIAYASTDTVSTPETLDTLTRGEPNGEWRGYQYDLYSSIGTWLTDRPVVWRGRIVELYAILVDAYGGTTGANILTNAAMVWRGHVATKPKTSYDGWLLSCRSQERRLEEPIGVEVSGSGKWVYDSDPYVRVDPAWSLTVKIFWQAGTTTPDTTFSIQPFSSLSPGDEVPLSQVRASIKNGWAVAVAAAGAPTTTYVSGMLFQKLGSNVVAEDGSIRTWWQASYWGSCAAGNTSVWVGLQIEGPEIEGLEIYSGGGAVNGGNQWPASPAPTAGWITTTLQCYAKQSLDCVDITLDEGIFADIPSTGYVICELGDEDYAFEYDSVSQLASSDAIRVSLVDGQAGVDQLTADAVEGGVNTFSVRFATMIGPDTSQDAMRRALSSSGRGDNDAYDTLGRRSGLDLDCVDTASFSDVVDGEWVGLGEQQILLDKRASWAKVWGGLLALSGRCVVSSPAADSSAVEIRVVRTTVCDTGTAATTITDSELLVSGDGTTPIREVPDREAPNVIEVKLRDQHGEDIGTILSIDAVLREACGEIRWSLTSDGLAREPLAAAVASWAKMLSSDAQSVRLYEITAVPWLAHADGSQIRVGDVIRVDSSHFRLTDPATAQSGLTGPARVLGWQIQPHDYAMRLLVGVSSVYTAYALAPSAAVVAYDHATVTTTIDVSEDYYDLMTAYLAGVSDFDLVAYVPSYDDASTDGYTIDAVTLIPGAPDVTRLSVSAITGSPDLSTATHYLTLPVRASCNTAQARHLQTDTPGAVWR